MKITKQHLKQIVLEELTAVFEERGQEGPWFSAQSPSFADIFASKEEEPKPEPEEYEAQLSDDDDVALQAALEADREKQEDAEWSELMALAGARYAIRE
jgi:hypothetical protein